MSTGALRRRLDRLAGMVPETSDFYPRAAFTEGMVLPLPDGPALWAEYCGAVRPLVERLRVCGVATSQSDWVALLRELRLDDAAADWLHRLAGAVLKHVGGRFPGEG